jgi:hypothetical protein
MTETADQEDDPSSVIEEWGVVLVGAQLRLVRLLFELMIGKEITERAEARALLYRHAEGMTAIADRVGLERLSYDIAKQFECLADDLVELLDGH